MTRKDYELIAKALKEAHGRFNNESNRHAIAVAASVIAAALAEDNDRFDIKRFIAATGTND